MPLVPRLSPVLLILGLAAAPAAAAPPLHLDRQAVLDLARGRSAAILAGRERLGVAEGDLAAARTWRFNPQVEFAGGPRRTPLDESFDRSLLLSQQLDLAGRGARSEAARRGRDAVRAATRAEEIAILAAVARAHLQALHAGQRHDLATDTAALHARLLDVARRREAAGEIGAVEVNLAAVAAARAAADTARTAAEVQAALGELADLLALDPGTPLAVSGELAWPLDEDLPAVEAAARRHPALPALAARQAEAEARSRAAASARLPELTLAAGVGREEDADLVRFGLGLSLPVFSRGSGEAQAAAAEARAVGVERVAAERSRLARAARAWHRHRLLQAAAEAFARDAVAAQRGGLDLVEASYRAGRIDLGQVLIVQREHLQARRDLADLRLETALAALEAAAVAGLAPLSDPEELP